ncbi:MAG: glycosyltransferase family 4 protein [Polyangiaceae bacterium]
MAGEFEAREYLMPSSRWLIACGIAFLVSAVGCEVVRTFAVRHALLDKPNARSLHQVPVPRIGGVAVVLSVYVAFLVANGFAVGFADPGFKMLALAVPVAVAGLVDDLKPLPASIRFALQIAVSLGLLFFVDQGPLTLWKGYDLTLSRPVFLALGTIWIVAVLNIYNFMDGMDGLAGSQTFFAGASLAYVLAVSGRSSLSILVAATAAAAAGFLLHNRPPARIFMGDACSTFLGFLFAAVPVVSAMPSHDAASTTVPFLAGPLALAPFLLDGTFTLLRRASKGEKVWQAHRTHLYQRAVATGLGHRDVLVRYLAWFVVSASAVVMAVGGREWTAIVTVVLGLALTWSWVRRRETLNPKKPDAA